MRSGMKISDETDRDMGDLRAYLCVTRIIVKQRDLSSLRVLLWPKMRSQHVLELALL